MCCGPLLRVNSMLWYKVRNCSLFEARKTPGFQTTVNNCRSSKSIEMLERWYQALKAALMAPPNYGSTDLTYGENLSIADDLVLEKRDGFGENGLLRLLREAVAKLNCLPRFVMRIQ